jgi:outer membrane protein assembly factor BamB
MLGPAGALNLSDVVAINAATGAIAWTSQFLGPIVGPLTLAPRVLNLSGGATAAILATVETLGGGAQVMAFDAATGQTLFSPAGPYDTQAAVGNGLAYVGGTDGQLYALDLTKAGATAWSNVVDPGCMNCRVEHNPAVEGNQVVAVSSSGVLASFDATTGAVLWRTSSLGTPQGGETAPTLGDGKAIIIWADEVFALDLTSGAPLWTFAPFSPSPQGEFSLEGAPSLANGVVYLTSVHSIVLLDATNGTKLGEIPGSNPVGQVAVGNGHVVFENRGEVGIAVFGL